MYKPGNMSQLQMVLYVNLHMSELEVVLYVNLDTCHS